MKHILKLKYQILFLYLIVSIGNSFTSLAHAVDSSRQTILFNREWKYTQGDYPGAEQPNYDDKGWEAIGLPHSFSMPYFMSKDFYVGYGWYRKSFILSTKEITKSVFLEFDGVFQEAEIFVNGKQVGTHVGGYTGFTIDASSAVQPGQNLLAVRVNNIWKPNVAPRAGEHVFSGGIYRDVRLVLKSPLHIDWCGTWVTTPNLQKNQGASSPVKVITDICNRSAKTAHYKLVTEILNQSNQVMASVVDIETLKAHTTKQITQKTPSVVRPALWSPESPTLYKVVSSLYQRGNLVDRTETIFGFRWMEWTADKGFFLNGKHRYLKGANVHQDHAGWGDAVMKSGMQRDVRMLKDAGFDFIRGSHYPHAPAFSQACDEEGILFWSEAPFWGIGGFKPDGYWDSGAYPTDEKACADFEESAMQQLTEMIHIHRNHPSIVAWSMCNEAFFSAPETMPGVRRLLQRMVDLSRRLDPTRPAAVGGVQRPLGQNRIDKIGDIAGYNGDGGTIADFQNPGVPNLVSEYGSTTADRPGDYIPGWGDLQRDDAWKEHSWRSGQAIWCGFDHGSIAGSQLGKMGIIDYFRIPKRSWYWYRNEYRQVAPPEWAVEGTPAQLRLTASQTDNVRADGTEDVMLSISVLDNQGKELSNSPSVTLKLLSGPGEFPTGTSITFDKESDIRILDGKAAIEFRSYYSGVAVIEATSPGLKPMQVAISFIDAPAYVKGKTPVVKERPYVRFTKTKAEGESIQTFGRNNPTFASSSAVGHPAGYAADGDIKTWWQATEKDEAPCWTLDTEKGLALHLVSITFPEEKPYQYWIEVSADNEHWNLLSDQSRNNKNVKRDEITVKEETKQRFVRIRFCKNEKAGVPALREVIVKGVVLD